MFSLRNKDGLASFQAPLNGQKNQYAIYSHPGYGPTFGGGYDLYISDNNNVNQKSYSYFGHTYTLPAGYRHGNKNTKNLLAGSYKFTPSEIEVFH